jgi:hypothetical protein
VRLAVAILAALIAAPAALAWLPVAPNVPNSMRPSVIRLRSNTELVAFSDGKSTLRVASSGLGTHTIATGLASVGQPAIVQTSSAVELYAPAATTDGTMSGVLRWESKNDGITWTGPFPTASRVLGGVESAAVRADGTPMFSQDSTTGITVFQGLNGELSHQAFAACCGYGESLAVDSANHAQIAFWSNGGSVKNRYVFQSLDATGARSGAPKGFGAPNTVSNSSSVPLVADGAGSTFMGWAPGYPTSTGFTLNTFRAGKLVRSTVVAKGKFTGGDPHMALAVDPNNRLWAVWSQGQTVYAKRSRDGGKTFGAATSFPGSTVYQLSAAAQAGQVDVFANDGHQISEQTFLPGLTVKVAAGTATVLDDGFPVNMATLTAGTTTVKTDASGKASLAGIPSGTVVTVRASSYAATSFKAP